MRFGKTAPAIALVMCCSPSCCRIRAARWEVFTCPQTCALVNAGSRTWAEAGLAHYTTRLDQVKEINESSDLVNIGLHYVATAGPNSTAPRDSDNDGIPDYIEDADGDGQWDEDVETRIDTAYTESGVHDSLSSVYDDIDLDGDGLPGAAERMLATDPLTRDNPLSGASLTILNTVSGLVIIPLPIAPLVGDAMFIEWTVNGEPTAARVRKVDGNWFVEWDTTLLLNGGYYVALEVQAPGQSRSIVCPGKFVTVQNAIWFPDNSLTVGDELNITAQTIHTNGTWTMEIYDDQGNLFHSLEGDVDEYGFCNYPDASHQGVSLSLLDAEGNPLPSDYYMVVVTTHAPSGGSSATTTTTRYRERPWNNYRPGRWVIAYQPLYMEDSPGSTDQYDIMNRVVGFVYANVLAGGSYSEYGGRAVVDTPGPTGGSYDVMELRRLKTKWDQFKAAIGSYQDNLDVRNLFYFGHCASSLGRGNLGGTPDPDYSTDAVRLGAQLLNSSDWSIGAVNRHPYRLVFICGCNSANTDLPQAFGIPKQEMSSWEWARKYPGLPRRAFLGFKGPIPDGTILGQPPLRMNSELKAFLTTFWETWVLPDPTTRQKRTLEQAVKAAKKAAASNREPSFFFHPLEPQIYGCSDLLFDER